MSGYRNFTHYVAQKASSGSDTARKLEQESLRKRKAVIELALKQAREVVDPRNNSKIPQELIEQVERRAMLDGSYELTPAGAQKIMYDFREGLKKAGDKAGKDYLSLIDRFDKERDADLIANTMFCFDPEIRDKVGGNYETIYKVVLNSGFASRKGHSPTVNYRSRNYNDIIPDQVRELLASLPEPKTTEEETRQRMLITLIRKGEERDKFPLFRKDSKKAIRKLEESLKNEKDPRVREVYSELRDNYVGYTEFVSECVNPNFIDPENKQKGVLPSLHQRIAMYHLVREGAFGIFDGCGTGKTAIAILAQPLIEKQMKKDGKEFRRTLVVCPNPAKKAWKKGLIGNENERYLVEQQNIAVINGEKKDEDFLEDIKDKKWVIINYEQLLAKVPSNGKKKLFVEALIDLGFDYVIFDESHHIRSQREETKGGKPTISRAAQALARKAGYKCMLSGSPIPNDFREDYAVTYSILNSDRCPNPEKFWETHKGSPRALYTLFNERTIRRTSEDINENLKHVEPKEFNEPFELDEVQRKLYDHILDFNPANGMIQARKALLDPRLVDPEILMKAGLIGKLGRDNSAKYRRLEEILADKNGPIAKKEKFVIFSSMFRRGVTQKEHDELKEKYEKLGLIEEFEKLGLDDSLEATISKELKDKFGRDFKIGVIDGTVPDAEIGKTGTTRREKIVDNLKDNLDGIICTTDTGGESLDFTPASWAIFLDEDYSPETMEQAESRLIRKGQKKTVKVVYLRGKNTLDEGLRDYVKQKEVYNKMATDGHPLTDEEKQFLKDKEGTFLWESERKRTIGGKSIDVTEVKITDIDSLVSKVRHRSSRSGVAYNPNDYDTTDAQKLNQWIGKDPNCWDDEEFAIFYDKVLPNLSVPVVHRAKIIDLIRRHRAKKIKFPGKIVSEGSGPSLLYSAYQDLRPVLAKYGLRVPYIVDRDTSKEMLKRGKNPHQVLANMNGDKSPFKAGTFDMVDNESITLLGSAEDVKKTLLESSRILKPEGLLELAVQNRRFSDSFYSGLERLGFRVLNRKHEGFAVGDEFFSRLKQEKGERYASAYASKLTNTHFILANKKDNPAEVPAEDFQFERIVPDESVGTSEEVKLDRSGELAKRRKVKDEKKLRPALPGEIPGLNKKDERRAKVEE